MYLHVIDLKLKEWWISQENIVINNIHLLKKYLITHLFKKKHIRCNHKKFSKQQQQQQQDTHTHKYKNKNNSKLRKPKYDNPFRVN